MSEIRDPSGKLTTDINFERRAIDNLQPVRSKRRASKERQPVMRNKRKFFKEVGHLVDMIESNSGLIELIRKRSKSKFKKRKDDFFLSQRKGLKDDAETKSCANKIREIRDSAETPTRIKGYFESELVGNFHKFNKVFEAKGSAEPSFQFYSTKEIRGRLISMGEITSDTDPHFENSKITNFASTRFLQSAKPCTKSKGPYISPVNKRLRFSPKKKRKADVTPQHHDFRFDLHFHNSSRRIERASENVESRPANVRKFSLKMSPQKVFSQTRSQEKKGATAMRKKILNRTHIGKKRTQRNSGTGSIKVYVVGSQTVKKGYSFSTSAMSF